MTEVPEGPSKWDGGCLFLLKQTPLTTFSFLWQAAEVQRELKQPNGHPGRVPDWCKDLKPLKTIKIY